MIHAFKACGLFMLLDVESGAVHQIDEATYALARALEEGKERMQALEELCAVYPRKELQEILEELDALERAGELNTPPLDYIPMQGKPVIKSMCLNVAHDCNLRCSYCFASTGEYHLGRALMPLSVGKKALDFLATHSGNRQHLEVDFFGGEPLMNFGVVKQLVEYGRMLEKQYNKKIAFTMTTNALAADEEVVEFCSKEISNLVISVDGRREVHDRTRKTANGKGSFDLILPKAKMLAFPRQEAGQDYYIRGTFTRYNLDFLEDVRFLADEGFEQISIEPVVAEDADPSSLRMEDMPRIFEEYDKLAEMFYERRKNGRWFNFFHFMVDLAGGPCAAKRMSGCGAGNEYVAVTPQGDIYPCHQFVGKKEFIMGSVITGELNSSMQARFRGTNVQTKEACRKCWAKYYCSGGCAANAFNFNGDISQPYEPACVMERKRVECALALYAKEHADGEQA